MPATNKLKINTRLTNVSIAYKNDGYVADEVLPILLVPKQAGLILEGDKAALQADASGDDAIGQGQKPGIIKTEIQDKTYSTKERAKGVTVHDDEVDADNAEEAPYEVKVQKTELATERLLLNREVRVAALCAGVSATSSPSTKWDNGSSDPLADVIPALLTIKNAIGVPPSDAVIPWEVLQYLRNNTALKAFFAGGATTTQMALLSIDALRAIFGVKRIHVPMAGKLAVGTMIAGFKSGSTSGVWSDNVTFFYRPDSPGRQVPAFGYTYRWRAAFRGAAANAKGQVVTEHYEDRERTLYIDARTYTDEQKLLDEAAYTFTNVLAAI
jgi:hypothetical protein